MKRVTLVKQAAYMAIGAHGNQTYDGYPYYYHLEEVVDTLKEFGYTEDKYIISGYLHDIIEDAAVSYQKLKRTFGEEIAEIVYGVTDEMGRNRTEKKAKTLIKTAQNKDSIIIKLADRLSNLRNCIKTKNDKIGMYKKEYSTFKAVLYIDGHAEEMWEEMDKLTDTL